MYTETKILTYSHILYGGTDVGNLLRSVAELKTNGADLIGLDGPVLWMSIRPGNIFISSCCETERKTGQRELPAHIEVFSQDISVHFRYHIPS